MIGPVSETGRTMMASLQQAMSKGMPVDQAIAYVKSMANDGVAPLVDLYALMKQFERMKRQPTPALQTPNIREQMNMLQSAQQGQAGLPAAMPPQNPQAMMSQGLGGLPAGRMENPSFAGGGIVAFDEGGTANTAAPQMYSDIPKYKTWEEMQAANIARLGQDPTKFVETEEERIRREQQERGLGEYAQSMSMREKLLAEDKAAAERVAEEEAGLDRDEYWGDVAANAAESGATLLSSLAKAQKGKASRKRATAEKVKKATRDAKLAEIALLQVKELEKAGRFKEAAELKKTIYADIEKASDKITEATAAEAKADTAFKRAVKLKGIQGAAANEAERLRRELGRTPRTLADGKPNPKYSDLQQRLKDVTPGPKGIPAEALAELRDKQAVLKAAIKRHTDFEGNVNKQHPDVVNAQRDLNEVKEDLVVQGYYIPGISPLQDAYPTDQESAGAAELPGEDWVPD
jgi:hypothetical protein